MQSKALATCIYICISSRSQTHLILKSLMIPLERVYIKFTQPSYLWALQLLTHCDNYSGLSQMALLVIYDVPTLALVLPLIAVIVRLPLSQSLLCRISSSLKNRSLRLILCRDFLPTLSSISKSTLYPVFQGPEFGRVAVSLMFSLSKMGPYTQSLRLYMISTDLWSVSRRMNYHSLNRKLGKVFIVTDSGAVTYSMECSDRIR